MTLKPKPIGLIAFIDHQSKLMKKFNLEKTEKQIENQKKEFKLTNESSAIFTLLNLLEKQYNDLKEIILEFEKRLIILEGE